LACRMFSSSPLILAASSSSVLVSVLTSGPGEDGVIDGVTDGFIDVVIDVVGGADVGAETMARFKEK